MAGDRPDACQAQGRREPTPPKTTLCRRRTRSSAADDHALLCAGASSLRRAASASRHWLDAPLCALGAASRGGVAEGWASYSDVRLESGDGTERSRSQAWKTGSLTRRRRSGADEHGPRNWTSTGRAAIRTAIVNRAQQRVAAPTTMCDSTSTGRRNPCRDEDADARYRRRRSSRGLDPSDGGLISSDGTSPAFLRSGRPWRSHSCRGSFGPVLFPASVALSCTRASRRLEAGLAVRRARSPPLVDSYVACRAERTTPDLRMHAREMRCHVALDAARCRALCGIGELVDLVGKHEHRSTARRVLRQKRPVEIGETRWRASTISTRPTSD